MAGLAVATGETVHIHPSLPAVRDQMVDQHARLRVLLDRLDAAAETVVRAHRGVPSGMEGLLDGLVRELATHMAFEEQALSSTGSWQDSDLVRLGKEHERQREDLARITREALGSNDRVSLALAIRAFVDDVRLDMTVEEESLQRSVRDR